MTTWTPPADAVLAARGLLDAGLVTVQDRKQCQYKERLGWRWQCNAWATRSVHTRTVAKDYCDSHFSEVSRDLRARTPVS